MNGHEICAIIISYNPDESMLRHIDCLLPQVKKIFIIDNASDAPSQVWLNQLERDPAITIMRNMQNLGIAAALNLGVARAINEQYTWIATFDQDSCVSPNFFHSMQEAYQACDNQASVGMITPVYRDPSTQLLLKSRKCNGRLYAEITGNMTSGNLIKSEVFHAIGDYRSDFFIDYVDYEFCLRMRKHHFRIIQSCETILSHRLGNPSIHHFFGKTCTTLNQPPTRCYYRARNRILVYRDYFFSDSIFCLRDMVEALKDIIKIILLESNATQKLHYLCLGIWHGILGKRGELIR